MRPLLAAPVEYHDGAVEVAMRLWLDRLLLVCIIVGLVAFSIWLPTHWETTRGGSVTPEAVKRWANERSRVKDHD
jgi:H+/Cl- antiporter ClcA